MNCLFPGNPYYLPHPPHVFQRPKRVFPSPGPWPSSVPSRRPFHPPDPQPLRCCAWRCQNPILPRPTNCERWGQQNDQQQRNENPWGVCAFFGGGTMDFFVWGGVLVVPSFDVFVGHFLLGELSVVLFLVVCFLVLEIVLGKSRRFESPGASVLCGHHPISDEDLCWNVHERFLMFRYVGHEPKCFVWVMQI